MKIFSVASVLFASCYCFPCICLNMSLMALFGTWFKQLTSNQSQLNSTSLCLSSKQQLSTYMIYSLFGNKSTGMWSYEYPIIFIRTKFCPEQKNVVMKLLTISLSLLFYQSNSTIFTKDEQIIIKSNWWQKITLTLDQRSEEHSHFQKLTKQIIS